MTAESGVEPRHQKVVVVAFPAERGFAAALAERLCLSGRFPISFEAAPRIGGVAANQIKERAR
jgi:hypothetical protein